MKEIKKRIKKKVEKGLQDLGRTKDQIWNTNLNGDREAIYRGVKVIDGDELSIWSTIGYTYRRIAEVDSLKVIEKFILDKDFNLEPAMADAYLVLRKKYNNTRSRLAQQQRVNRALKVKYDRLVETIEEYKKNESNYKII